MISIMCGIRPGPILNQGEHGGNQGKIREI